MSLHNRRGYRARGREGEGAVSSFCASVALSRAEKLAGREVRKRVAGRIGAKGEQLTSSPSLSLQLAHAPPPCARSALDEQVGNGVVLGVRFAARAGRFPRQQAEPVGGHERERATVGWELTRASGLPSASENR